MSLPSNLKLKIDNVASVAAAIGALGKRRVLVGVPSEGGHGGSNTRRPEDGKPVPINNASIAYIQDNGAPEVNIPQREFLRPGIELVQKQIDKALAVTGRAALEGDLTAVDRGLNVVGLIGQNAVRGKITDGPFQPLADSTVAARARRGRKGAKEELARRAAGLPPGVDLARPLIDTAQLRSAITYVVRDREVK